MYKTLCQRCFHYAACEAMDVTGAIGNPEMENTPCDHFIDADRVKIQDKANWREQVDRYSDGSAYVCYYCTCCGKLRKVKGYKKHEWENYYSEHYRDEIELPKFCEMCRAVTDGIVEDSGD